MSTFEQSWAHLCLFKRKDENVNASSSSVCNWDNILQLSFHQRTNRRQHVLSGSHCRSIQDVWQATWWWHHSDPGTLSNHPAPPCHSSQYPLLQKQSHSLIFCLQWIPMVKKFWKSLRGFTFLLLHHWFMPHTRMCTWIIYIKLASHFSIPAVTTVLLLLFVCPLQTVFIVNLCNSSQCFVTFQGF